MPVKAEEICKEAKMFPIRYRVDRSVTNSAAFINQLLALTKDFVLKVHAIDYLVTEQATTADLAAKVGTIADDDAIATLTVAQAVTAGTKGQMTLLSTVIGPNAGLTISWTTSANAGEIEVTVWVSILDRDSVA